MRASSPSVQVMPSSGGMPRKPPTQTALRSVVSATSEETKAFSLRVSRLARLPSSTLQATSARKKLILLFWPRTRYSKLPN